MPYYKPPKEFRFYTVITMYNSVASINYRFGIREIKVWFNFQYSVNCFSHYLRLALNSTAPEVIPFKHLVFHWIIDKVAFELLDSDLDIH